MQYTQQILNSIILGDCKEILPHINDKSIDLVLTDIPYGECDKDSGGLRVLDKGSANTLNFDLRFFAKEMNRICKGSVYIFCGIGQISELYNELRKEMTTRLCVWEKSNPSPMNGQYFWLSALEACVFARHKNAAFNENCKPNIWRFGCGKSHVHPTEKPLDLFAYLIQTSSNKGDVVFDPCIGAGTTAVACVATERRYIGIEIDPNWHRIALRRASDEKQKDIFRTNKY